MSAPAVIVTRAQPGADATAAGVRDLGLRAIVSPALRLCRADPVPHMLLEDAGGLLFTSMNGVRFFCEVSERRDIPAWCVGPATLAAAQNAGFSETMNADGNAQDLAALVIENATPQRGHLIHVANTAAGNVLQSQLSDAGFEVHLAGLYSPMRSSKLSAEAVIALESMAPVCVLLHSAKGAAAFASLAAAYDLNQTTFISISDKAAKPVVDLGKVLVAARPNENSLLRVLKEWQLAL